MASKEENYHLFQEDDDDSSSISAQVPAHPSPAPIYRRSGFLVNILLVLSVILNLIFVLSSLTSFNYVSGDESYNRSLYAKLAADTMMPWDNTTAYTNSNLTLSDEAFKTLSADDGVVALDQEWAAANGLPPSTGLFPWDRSKRMYVINGYHGIHCIAQLHRSFREYRDGVPQSHDFAHNNHCLDWLRNDIMCQADDTPLYTDNSMQSTNGIGQVRQCRDWSKLEAWAKERPACFRYGDFVTEEKLPSQVGRFKFCPDDSPYLPKVRKYFGMGADWLPAHLPYVG
ncbi:MAG: hypothetical protein M1818_007395 [Claussenomyces sp. TS43310]|nr:MAG: hypothetical protein M1818_007395 [Claussenomyces sp. TS43310]